MRPTCSILATIRLSAATAGRPGYRRATDEKGTANTGDDPPMPLAAGLDANDPGAGRPRSTARLRGEGGVNYTGERSPHRPYRWRSLARQVLANEGIRE